jgi:predicted metal-dependent enzyme (double-stranded beta helix superfamily)
MTTPIPARRRSIVEPAIANIKEIASKPGLDRAALGRILEIVKALAAQRELWSAHDFRPPEPGVRQARYLIREDADHGYALYLNVMRRGNRTPIHNHTTWACIAAVEGAEHNYVYRRLDDGSKPGYAEVVEDRMIVVRPGTGIGLMPDDIHAVEIREDEIIRHLHLYGRALETLTERVAYDLERCSYAKMDIGVKTRRAPEEAIK